MKILIVSQYFWPETFRINDLAVALREKGHQVTVLTGIPNYPEGLFFKGYGLFKRRSEEYKGIRIVRVPIVSRGKSKGFRLVLNYFSFMCFASILGLFYFFWESFDAIFVCQLSPVTVGIPAIVLKKIKKAPILLWVLDLWPETLSATGAVTSKRIIHLFGRVVRYIYRRSDRILIASRGFAESVMRWGGEKEKILYFPNWAEEIFPREMKTSKAPGLSRIPDGFRILFAGNIGISQDFGTILEAAERLRDYPDIHWVIVGDGRMSEWVREEIQKKNLGKNVHMAGRHPLEEMPRFYAMADALLVTLKNDPVFALTVPGKLQSYFAGGKPVISALDGDGRRIVEESGAGIACPAGNPELLATAVLSLYRMTPDERQKMGDNARNYYQAHFEREMLMDRLEKWMLDISSNGVKKREAGSG